MNKSAALIFGVSLLCTMQCAATVLVTGDATTPYTFTVSVTAKTYDTNTGTLYLGLESQPSTKPEFIISKAPRPIGANAPAFTAIGSKVENNAAIGYLALVTYPGNLSPLIAYTQTGNYVVYAITNDGAVEEKSATLKDGNDVPAPITGDIRALAANRYYAFAAVPPANGNFGDDNSGIAVVCVKQTASAIVLTQTEQTIENGTDPQVRAKQLDTATPAVWSNNHLTSIADSAQLYWDEQLQRLYIGIQGKSNSTNNAGIKSVVVGQLDTNATLTFINIVKDSFIDQAIDTNMVLAATTAAQIQKDLAILHLGVMHCSTGPSYLIINGGNGTATQTSNTIYALPLIDNVTSSSHGALASKTGYNPTTHVFDTPPSSNGDLPRSTENQVQVGTGPLPIAADSLAVSDLVIIGDTVYVAITGLQNSTHDNGVFYSQALFAADGRIVDWTPWTKRAFPYRGFCDNTSCVNPACTTPPGCNTGCQPGCTSMSICDIGCQNEGVLFCAVDAVNGKVWAVDGTTKEIVRLTAWDRGGCISQLPCILSQLLADGTYAVLDLDQATQGFYAGTVGVNTTQERYALFGGCNKVAFARISEAIPFENEIILQSPQTIITAFSTDPTACTPCTTNKQNFLLTTIADAGCVNQLEYSRRSFEANPNNNYFFAGTNNGLYVFAQQNDAGFTVDQLSTLDQPPFSSGVWHTVKAPFNEPIIAIKTTGLYLYVITRTIHDGNIKCTLYLINFTNNTSTMFANPIIIAQTGVAPFADVLDFTAIQPVNDGTNEQLFLATNKGLFVSDTITGVAPAWHQVPADVTTMFAGIAGIDTPFPRTVWPFSVEDTDDNHIFDCSSIYQISGPTVDPSTLTFVPAHFNANSCSSAFDCYYPITSFWSDGARRFFIINRTCEELNRNRLMVVPYEVGLWHVTNPAQQLITYDSYVVGADRFFWVKQIGASGMLMAGTNRGVIALE